MEFSVGLATLFLSVIISATAVNEETCAGLENLMHNVNPTLLSNCMVDEDCTSTSCDSNGALAVSYSSVTFTVEPCGVRPGVKIELTQVQENGRAIPPQLVFRQTVISIGPLTVIVFLNSTDTAVNIAIEYISITTAAMDFSDYLLNLTSLYIDRTGCNSNPVSGVTMATTAVMTSEDLEEVINRKTTDVATATPTATDKSTTETNSMVKPGSNALACAGLEQLAMNTDPRAFSKCFRDSSCSKLTCQTSSNLTRQLDTFTITLRPCSTLPGVTIEFTKGGESFLTQMISRPILINSTIGSATLEADVFVNSTGSTIGLSVDPVTIHEVSISEDPVLYRFVNFTLVPIDTVYFCSSGVSVHTSLAYAKLWNIFISCNLSLLTLTILSTLYQ